MVNLTKIFTYDIETTPGFNNAFMMPNDLVKLEHVDLFVNNLMDKQNILIKSFITGLYPYKVKVIKKIIDNNIILKQKDECTLDVLIICRFDIQLRNLRQDISKMYYDENRLVDQTVSKLKIKDCNIVFKTYQKELNGYNEDLVIYEDVLDMRKIERDSCMFRRDGSLITKSVVFNEYNEDLIKLGYHWEDPNKWSEEMYKKMIREKKLERVLKND